MADHLFWTPAQFEARMTERTLRAQATRAARDGIGTEVAESATSPELHNASLCTVCRRIVDLLADFLGFSNDGSHITHVKGALLLDFPELEAAEPLDERASRGCNLCLKFLGSIPDVKQEEMRSIINHNSSICVRYKIELSTFHVTCRLVSENVVANGMATSIILGDGLDFRPERDPSDHAPQLNLQDSTDSDQTLNTVNQWLRDCKIKHTGCPAVGAPFVPTRLIDVGTSIPPRLRLVLGESISKNSSYVTLSHRWGKNLPIQLENDKVEEFMEEIPFHKLSTTFQEATMLTQRLGQRFLWIDSLCIVQDSPQDWQNEVGSMAKVYTHSYCNIAALTDRLFIQRRLGEIRATRLQLGTEGGVYRADDPACWQNFFNGNHLMGRGWVCQERFLSPCNLYFGEREVYWECATFSASEAHPTGCWPHPPPVGREAAERRRKQCFSSLTRGSGTAFQLSIDQLFNDWELLVQSYSAMSLSYPMDRLMAIAGLADESQKRIGGKYLAGLWEKRLMIELLWRFPHLARHNLGPRQYTAPSWSWASVDAGVEFFRVVPRGDTGEDNTDVVDVAELVRNDVVLVDKDNPYGQVLPGSSLRVRGCLTQIIIQPVNDTAPRFMPNCQLSWDTPTSGALTEYYLFPLIVKPEFLQNWHTGTNEAGMIRGLILEAAQGECAFHRRGTFVGCGDGAKYPQHSWRKAITEFSETAARIGLKGTKCGKLGYTYTFTLI